MRVNPWLKELIERAEKKGIDPKGFKVIIQVDPTKQEEIKVVLRRMGVRVLGQVTGFIQADVPDVATLEKISKIEGVINISYDVPVYPMAVEVDQFFKQVGILADPILSQLKPHDLEALGLKVKPTAIMPKIGEAILTPKIPFGVPPVITRRGVEWTLVTETRKIIEAPEDFKISPRTKVAVIDSGLSPHPAMRKFFHQVVMTIDLPMDTMGHGQWCSTCAFGDPAPSRYGKFIPVASASKLLHVKVFSAFGPCSAFQVMRAMEYAAKWGAKVISMSLGGPLQGSVTQDPECVLLDNLTERYGCIFVVAAGNEGPDEWTIASPGAALKALTVGSYSWKYGDVAVFSSRGPQGEWYKEHKDVFESDYAKYRDILIKPDVLAPGGGPVKEGQVVDQIVAGVTGWYDGFYDFAADGFEMMRGTSMATPHVAGLVAWLVDRGKVRTVDDIKNVMRRAGKDIARGWGLIRKSYF